MPDENPPKSPASASNDPNSLADLLPEYFDDYPAAPNPGSANPGAVPGRPSPVVPVAVPVRKTSAKARTGKGDFNYLALGLVALLGIIVLPLLVFGVFVIIANTQPAQTTINVGQAISPLATVYSVTPGPTSSTPALTGKAAPGGNATATAPGGSACPPQAAIGQVLYYTCAKPVQSGGNFTTYFSLAEIQLAQDGQNGPSASRIFAVSPDSPAKVLAFYANHLPAQGYAQSGPVSNGTTPLGNYSAALYTKSGQQVQIVALTVTKASPEGQVSAGQTLIRLSSS